MTRPRPTQSRDTAKQLMTTGATAFADLESEIAALPDELVLPMDVTVPCIAVAVTLAVPRIEQVLAGIPELPQPFDLSRLRRLQSYAAAAWHAYARAFAVNPSRVSRLQSEVVQCRTTLLMYATALAQAGWLGEPPHPGIGKQDNPRALAHDVLELAELLSDAWPRIETVGLQGWHLARASAIGFDLLIASSLQAQRPPKDAGHTCARAMSTLAWVYEDCRTLIGSLRSTADLEDIAPSIGIPRSSDERIEVATAVTDSRMGARASLPN